MNLTEPVTIRLSTEKRFLYESEAASRKQSLRTYLRERLEKSESLSHQPSTNTTPSSPHEQGMLVEILLLLRCIAGTEKMYFVQKELNRLNIPVWKMDSFSKE